VSEDKKGNSQKKFSEPKALYTYCVNIYSKLEHFLKSEVVTGSLTYQKYLSFLLQSPINFNLVRRLPSIKETLIEQMPTSPLY
jgi:hypothetical protein